MEQIQVAHDLILQPLDGIDFSQQAFSEALFMESLPLLVKHYEEISYFKDIPLNPDFEKYARVARAGALRIFTARKFGDLIGYAVFLVQESMHFSQSYQAVQDVLFIDPEHRGFGHRFILWCDKQLQKEGVEVIYHTTSKRSERLGLLLEKLGYEEVGNVYARKF